MKRIAPLALSTVLLLTGFGFASTADARDRDRGHRNEHRSHERHRHEHRDHRRYDHGRHDRKHDRYDRKYGYRHRGHYDDHHKHRYGHRYRYGRHFAVPRHIRHAHGHGQRYGSYYRRHVYYAPHGHNHALYHFPVHVDGYWSYRPHYYCEGSLFYGHGSIGFHGDNFSFRIGF